VPGGAVTYQTVPSSCRLCPAACGVLVTLERGPDGARILDVAGDPDHPLSEGYTCTKGRAGADLHHHPERLDQPLLGRPGAGRGTASWDQTLGLVAAGVRRIVEESGPGAVAAYRGSAAPFDAAGDAVAAALFTGLGAARFDSLTLNASAKSRVGELMTGARVPWPSPDLLHTDNLLLVGQNPLVSHGHGTAVPNPVVNLRLVQARGTIVVVDPRESETAHLADVHVQLRPGTDPAFLAYVVREAFRFGVDEAALATCTRTRSVEEVRSRVLPWTPERTATVCGVDPDVLEQARDALLKGTPIAAATGTGTTMSPSANATEWLVWVLTMLTGSLDVRGGTVFHPGFLRPIERVRPEPAVDPGERAATRPDLAPVAGTLPTAALADEILAGNVRALFVLGGNPALSLPDSEKVRAALQRLDLLVVGDVRHTETTDLANVVLPLAGQFERADLTAGTNLPVVFAQYTPALVAPVAQRRSAAAVFGELGRRLGLPALGPDAPALPDPVTDDAVLGALAAGARVGWPTVVAARHGLVVDAPGPGWLLPNLLPRKIDLAPPELVHRFTAFEGLLPSPVRLALVPRRLPRQVNSALRDVGMQSALGPFPTLLMHPFDAAERGILDGSVVEVSTELAAVVASAEVTEAIRPGAVSLPMGWETPNVNLLTADDDCDPHTGMPRLSTFTVEVRLAPRADD